MTKLKNSNCDKAPKLKGWQNSKSQSVTKLKLWKKSKTLNVKKLTLWQNSKTLFKKKLKKNSNCDKTLIMKYVNVWRKEYLKGSFSKNILTPWQQMRCSLGSVLQFLQSFFYIRMPKVDHLCRSYLLGGIDCTLWQVHAYQHFNKYNGQKKSLLKQSIYLWNKDKLLNWNRLVLPNQQIINLGEKSILFNYRHLQQRKQLTREILEGDQWL